MPNIDSLRQTISQKLSNVPQKTAYVTTLDLQYAYNQPNLQAYTVSVDMTGAYRFNQDFKP